MKAIYALIPVALLAGTVLSGAVEARGTADVWRSVSKLDYYTVMSAKRLAKVNKVGSLKVNKKAAAAGKTTKKILKKTDLKPGKKPAKLSVAGKKPKIASIVASKLDEIKPQEISVATLNQDEIKPQEITVATSAQDETEPHDITVVVSEEGEIEPHEVSVAALNPDESKQRDFSAVSLEQDEIKPHETSIAALNPDESKQRDFSIVSLEQDETKPHETSIAALNPDESKQRDFSVVSLEQDEIKPHEISVMTSGQGEIKPKEISVAALNQDEIKPGEISAVVPGQDETEPHEITLDEALQPSAADEIRIADIIREMAPSYGVPTWFALRIAEVESNYDPLARGRAGEIGLYQLKCKTARALGFEDDCSDLTDVRTNVHWGLKHLARAIALSNGNLRLAASKHNAGLSHKSLVRSYIAKVF